MREIKFRGRENDERYGFRWVYGDLTHSFGSVLVAGRIVEEFTVGQFTGLRDENGREIYDGDIIDVDGEFIAEVVYCDGAYELYTKQGPLGKLSDIAYEYSLAIFDGVIGTFSVIGNIHDNPDLLEKRP